MSYQHALSQYTNQDCRCTLRPYGMLIPQPLLTLRGHPQDLQSLLPAWYPSTSSIPGSAYGQWHVRAKPVPGSA
eukprot:3066137-Rhodomonas_salina.4